jgi:hypothetical protein
MMSIPIVLRWQYRRLVNDAVDAYVEWRQRCGEVWVAYANWAAARASTVAPCYAAYAAAVDREERASQVYASLVYRVADLLAVDVEPVAAVGPERGGRW